MGVPATKQARNSSRSAVVCKGVRRLPIPTVNPRFFRRRYFSHSPQVAAGTCHSEELVAFRREMCFPMGGWVQRVGKV